MENMNPVVWFEIYVDDMKRAQKFYESVLNLKLTDMPTPSDVKDEMHMMAFPADMNGPGASGTLVKMKGFDAGNNSTIIYFGSEDCAVEEARVEKAGGKIFKSKLSLGDYGFMILAMDTEGNMFGVHSMS